MILLNGHSLEQKRRIVPEKLSLTITERDSTASMVPDSLSGITVKSWFLDETNPGKGIVWRVKSIGNDYSNETPTVELEHVITSLRDRILFGEVTPEMMGGGTSCTARQAVEYILRRSDDWKLGSFGFDGVSNPYKFDGDSLYDALVKVTKSLKDAWWSYDLTAYPFKLNITKRSETAGTELRCGRNLVSITRTQDTANMYTRFYPIGKDDLHIGGNYVERNTGSYGVIEHVEVNSGLETEAELIRWANEKLDVHAQPLDTIEIEGLELADATGEPLDRLRIGRVCRVPLPDYGTVIEEKITQIRYQDKLFSPEVVQITLANAQEDIAQILADTIKEGAGPMGAGGRGGARQEKEDHAWFEDTDTHVAMVAEGIVGTDADGNPDWARLSQLVVDGEGIAATVEVVKEEYGEMSSSIKQNEKAITAEVKRAKKAEGNLSTKIEITADGIKTKVDKNGVISAINQTAETIEISASRINLDGYVTMSDLDSTNGRITNLMSGNAVASLLNATTVSTSVLKVASSQATWQLKNIPGVGYINYLGAAV